MDTKIIVLASLLCGALIVCHVAGEPLEDKLPDTTGLFFGKRGSHPNMNNLLFGRRSYSGKVGASKVVDVDEAREACRVAAQTCSRWGFYDN